MNSLNFGLYSSGWRMLGSSDGVDFDIPVLEFKESYEGKVRHCLSECGNYHTENDVLGFVLVNFDDVPEEWQWNALLTNVEDSALPELLEHVGAAEFDKKAHQLWRSGLLDGWDDKPEQVWLGAYHNAFNIRQPVPTWAAGISIVESETLNPYTFRYEEADWVPPFD
ncbi:MAG: hypothetical protein AB8B50_04305, partial [Pirellulaceae bacterium]